VPGWIGPWELIILAFVLLLVFGPKRIPEIGRSLGKGARELRDSFRHDDEPTHPRESDA
jgi:sec-independent protein translocase protein TatA